jgi:hypothetical protein
VIMESKEIKIPEKFQHLIRNLLITSIWEEEQEIIKKTKEKYSIKGDANVKSEDVQYLIADIDRHVYYLNQYEEVLKVINKQIFPELTNDTTSV